MGRALFSRVTLCLLLLTSAPALADPVPSPPLYPAFGGLCGTLTPCTEVDRAAVHVGGDLLLLPPGPGRAFATSIYLTTSISLFQHLEAGLSTSWLAWNEAQGQDQHGGWSFLRLSAKGVLWPLSGDPDERLSVAIQYDQELAYGPLSGYGLLGQDSSLSAAHLSLQVPLGPLRFSGSTGALVDPASPGQLFVLETTGRIAVRFQGEDETRWWVFLEGLARLPVRGAELGPVASWPDSIGVAGNVGIGVRLAQGIEATFMIEAGRGPGLPPWQFLAHLLSLSWGWGYPHLKLTGSSPAAPPPRLYVPSWLWAAPETVAHPLPTSTVLTQPPPWVGLRDAEVLPLPGSKLKRWQVKRAPSGQVLEEVLSGERHAEEDQAAQERIARGAAVAKRVRRQPLHPVSMSPVVLTQVVEVEPREELEREEPRAEDENARPEPRSRYVPPARPTLPPGLPPERDSIGPGRDAHGEVPRPPPAPPAPPARPVPRPPGWENAPPAALESLNRAQGAAPAPPVPKTPFQAAGRPSTIRANAAQGAAYEVKAKVKVERAQRGVVQQVTVKTQSGVRTRLDMIGRDRTTGLVRATEAKSSPTAPLTKNQRAAFPEIQQKGATVVGKGKPGFPGGTQIPPTQVEIVRPK